MATRMTRVFVAYAEGDDALRERLIGQARNSKLTVEFLHMPTKQPWVPLWKGTCRTRVFQSDCAVVLVSKKTQGDAIKTELDFIREAQIPVLAVSAAEFTGTVPEQVRDARVVEWNWNDIGRFLQTGGVAGAGA
jgi:hypothetical protein